MKNWKNWINNNIVFRYSCLAKYKKNMWQEIEYDLAGTILTEDIYNVRIAAFWNEIEDFWGLNDVLHVIPKIRLKDKSDRSISDMRHIRKIEYDRLRAVLIDKWRILSDEYHISEISCLYFTFMIDDSGKSKTDIEFEKSDLELGEIWFFGKANLPDSTDFMDWGLVTKVGDDIYQVDALKYDWKLTVKVKEGVHDVMLMNKYDIFQTWTDRLGIDKGSFLRIIDNVQLFYDKGSLVFKRIEKQVKFIRKLNPDENLGCDNIITMDLETYRKGDKLHPYCIGIYEGEGGLTFYASDYSDRENMIDEAVRYLFQEKFNGYNLYLHNFSKFDSAFLLHTFLKLSKEVIPKFRNDLIVELRIRYNDENGNLREILIKDSYLILPASLASLAIGFSIDEEKGVFPHSFASEGTITYSGDVPNKDYFEIGEKEYEEYKSGFDLWSFKKESEEYCLRDCRVLYKVVRSYWMFMYNNYKIDINKYPTISSLSMALYRTHFMGEARIPIITGHMYNYLSEGYTGGSVDVIKPYGKKVYHYDVNSLYPYVMSKYDMPIGTPIYFEGDIFKLNRDAFGIFKARITCPKDIKNPILQLRQAGITLSPVGEWTSVYLSEELKNAEKIGYKVQVISGYEFQRGKIFHEYVDAFYQLKKKSKRDEPGYMISKLMLNTLYGRFGMKPITTIHKISNNHLELLNKNKVTNITHIWGDTYLYTIELPKSEKSNRLPVSIAVALSVTAYGRIVMSRFKQRRDLYYTDTDSIFIRKKLSKSLISGELGKFKLEGIYDEAVFLCPKVYGTKTKNKEKIKIKGFKDILSFSSMISILKGEKGLEMKQEKWFRSLESNTIKIKNQVYTLMITENKRVNIYKDGIFVDTKPKFIKK